MVCPSSFSSSTHFPLSQGASRSVISIQLGLISEKVSQIYARLSAQEGTEFSLVKKDAILMLNKLRDRCRELKKPYGERDVKCDFYDENHSLIDFVDSVEDPSPAELRLADQLIRKIGEVESYPKLADVIFSSRAGWEIPITYQSLVRKAEEIGANVDIIQSAIDKARSSPEAGIRLQGMLNIVLGLESELTTLSSYLGLHRSKNVNIFSLEAEMKFIAVVKRVNQAACNGFIRIKDAIESKIHESGSLTVKNTSSAGSRELREESESDLLYIKCLVERMADIEPRIKSLIFNNHNGLTPPSKDGDKGGCAVPDYPAAYTEDFIGSYGSSYSRSGILASSSSVDLKPDSHYGKNSIVAPGIPRRLQDTFQRLGVALVPSSYIVEEGRADNVKLGQSPAPSCRYRYIDASHPKEGSFNIICVGDTPYTQRLAIHYAANTFRKVIASFRMRAAVALAFASANPVVEQRRVKASSVIHPPRDMELALIDTFESYGYSFIDPSQVTGVLSAGGAASTERPAEAASESAIFSLRGSFSEGGGFEIRLGGTPLSLEDQSVICQAVNELRMKIVKLGNCPMGLFSFP